eukprot:CAMPEP_0170591856 /NCGR_PEP_ID=MMETSP0224-20130122/12625_1 /TAXON_ID=285029 /ORGANISM="Togula jolla, Strain CCCM 725" /LENGTH=521 /DNA_ID=CAMNT_0010915745 /DNA_START=58 /DNA_END=1624 /DNA_ORIENTATION=+
MAPSKSLEDIKLEDIDFESVRECGDKQVLKRYIKLIEDDGSYFKDLLNACRDKLLEVSPKEFYLLYPKGASDEEVNEITQELLSWETNVKETDAAIRGSRQKDPDVIWDSDASRVAAPIRGQEPVLTRLSLNNKVAEQRCESENQQPRNKYARDKTAMKDYYSAWDQVDVDALEAELEREEKEAEESRKRHFEELREKQTQAQAGTPIGDLPPDVPEAHRAYMADTEKEKGNEAFYAKDYDEAEAYYTRSLRFKADDPSTWANRALVRLKLQRPDAALEDCEHGLALNPRHMKALHRKGKALHDLNRFEEAVRCFQLALKESPGNTQINGDLMVARRKLRSAEQDSQPWTGCRVEELPDDYEGGSSGSAAGRTAGQAAAAPPAAPRPLRPSETYTRVQIEESSDSESEEERANEKGPTLGFRKMQIEEVIDTEDAAVDSAKAEEKKKNESKAPDRPTSGTFHKVPIMEDSDSEDDGVVAPGGTSAMAVTAPSASAPAISAAVPSAGNAPVKAAEICFDDMD